MDASFLNFHQEETFQAFHTSSYYLDDIYGDLSDQHYGWESERELHSDVGATPTSEVTGGFSERSSSPQHEVDSMSLLEKWTQHMSTLEIPTVSDLTEVCGPIQTEEAQDVLTNNVFCDKLLDKDELNLSGNFENVDPIGHLVDSDFDITKYVNEPDKVEENVLEKATKNSPKKSSQNFKESVGVQPGGKKIDMKNCRYIVKDDDSEEDVDVETLSECEDANSKDSLMKLEEKPEQKNTTTKVTSFDLDPRVLQAGDLATLLEVFENEVKNDKKLDNKNHDNKVVISKTKSKRIESNVKHKVKDKEIPTKHIKVKNKEDIKFVKEKLSKERVIVKKKIAEKNFIEKNSIENKTVENKHKKISINSNQKARSNLGNEVVNQRVKITVDPVKHEEKKGRIIKEIPIILPEHIERKRPVKKDLKLKQNGNQVVFKQIPKPIEKIVPKIEKPEVKIRENVIKSQKVINSIRLDHDYCLSNKSKPNTVNNHVIHQNTINQRSILRTQPTVKMADGKLMVSLLKVNTIKTIDSKKKLNLEEYKKRRQNRLTDYKKTDSSDKFWGLDPYPKLPNNMEMKTYVSIGVNTDQTWAKVQEITKRNGVNFSSNSLIASMVERLPTEVENEPQLAENKTIVYLNKDRPKKETLNKRVQTDIVRRRSRLSSSSSCSSRSSRSSSRSPSRSISPANRKRRRPSSERIKEIEERRVIYVGRIANGTTQEDLRRRFFRFGPISYISVHFRRTGDNYGFVTFRYKEDAYEAVEHGNDDPTLPRYELSFGGRRIFCKTSYADLDNMRDEYLPPHVVEATAGTFEDLLRDFQAKVRSKKIRSS